MMVHMVWHNINVMGYDVFDMMREVINMVWNVFNVFHMFDVMRIMNHFVINNLQRKNI